MLPVEKESARLGEPDGVHDEVPADRVKRDAAARKLLDPAVAADVVAVGVGADDEGGPCEVRAQIGDQLARSVEMGQVGRVDQHRTVRSVDEVVTVEKAPVNEEQARQDFGNGVASFPRRALIR